MQEQSIDRKVELTLPYLERAGLVAQPATAADRERVRQVVEAARDRIKVAGDILDFEDFFLPDDRLPYDEAAFDKQLRHEPEAIARLARFRDRLAASEEFDPAGLEKLLQTFVADERIPTNKIIHAVRVAVTGKTIGFGLFETLAILGRERVLARIDRRCAREVVCRTLYFGCHAHVRVGM